MSDISISSDECCQLKKEEDPVICWASNKVNRQNRAPIRRSDYLRLEEHGIIYNYKDFLIFRVILILWEFFNLFIINNI